VQRNVDIVSIMRVVLLCLVVKSTNNLSSFGSSMVLFRAAARVFAEGDEASLLNILVFIAISSSGLLFAALLVWYVLHRHARNKHRANERLAKIYPLHKLALLLLFCAEQLPETLVLAFGFVGGFVDLSLACFLFGVEFCSFSGRYEKQNLYLKKTIFYNYSA
jgi:hypothetical protein